MEDLKYWIWLSRIENISSIVLLRLLERFKSPKQIWNLKKEEIIETGETSKSAEKIISSKYRQNLEKYIEYMQKNKIETINYFDKYYPQKLKNIYDPPIVLYSKGNKKILNGYGLAIIGCREATDYGKYVSQKISYDLGMYNINVISGLARGVDSCAHIGSLHANANTIAVVGCGLDIIYPNENKYLFNNIVNSNRSYNI